MARRIYAVNGLVITADSVWMMGWADGLAGTYGAIVAPRGYAAEYGDGYAAGRDDRNDG